MISKSSGRAGIWKAGKNPSISDPPRTRARAKGTSSPANPISPGALQPAPSSRRSHALSIRQARLIRQGVDHANRIGLPLNRFITINWELAGIANPQWAHARFLKYLWDWLRRRQQHTAYVWVQEQGEEMGAHTHLLCHIPPNMIDGLNRLQRGWLKKIGAQTKARVLRSGAIGPSYAAALASDDITQKLYRPNLKKVVDYILKGSESEARVKLDIRRAPQYSIVIGKRAGTSRNVGAKAIRDFHAGAVSDAE